MNNNYNVGANITNKFISISMALVFGMGSIGVGLSRDCSKNNPVKSVCNTTKLYKMVFGEEKALKHLMIDLKREGINDVIYRDSDVIDIIPDNYLYINGKGVNYIIPNQIDGEYILDDGYTLTKLGNDVIGVKEINPIKLSIGKSISYDVTIDGVTTRDTWTYDSNKKDFVKYSLTKSIGNDDIITYCDKNTYLSDNYLYVPYNQSSPIPVRFFEEEVIDDNIYKINDIDYNLVGKVTFYNDKVSNKNLENAYKSHIYMGNIMNLIENKDSHITYGIYKKARIESK